MKFFIFFFLFGCVTKVPDSDKIHNPIVKETLRARNGKLSNTACKPESVKECIPDFVYYDLEDASVRNMLNDSKFFCDVGGRLFHICPNTAAVCRKLEPVVVKRFLWIPVKYSYPEEVIMQGNQFDLLSVVCKSILNK